MKKFIFKKETAWYLGVVFGGIISFYFTLNNVTSNQNSIFLIIGLFFLCAVFTLFFIFILKYRLEYQLNDLIALTFAFLFYGSMMIGYKLGWAEVFILPLIILLASIPFVLFLFKRPNNVVRGIFWLFFIGIAIILFSSTNKLIFSQYCELIKKGESNGGNCYPKNDYSIAKNILGIQINHPEVAGAKVTLSKRNGKNIVGKCNELFIPQKGDLNNRIEAIPGKLVMLPGSNKFTMPFATISKKGDKNYFLGLFEMNNYDQADSAFGYYKFYRSFVHLESQFIGKNIVLENTYIKDEGTVNGIFQKDYKIKLSQKYYDSINRSGGMEEVIILVDSATSDLMYLGTE